MTFFNLYFSRFFLEQNSNSYRFSRKLPESYAIQPNFKSYNFEASLKVPVSGADVNLCGSTIFRRISPYNFSISQLSRSISYRSQSFSFFIPVSIITVCAKQNFSFDFSWYFFLPPSFGIDAISANSSYSGGVPITVLFKFSSVIIVFFLIRMCLYSRRVSAHILPEAKS